jgi:hypothetical protein
VVELEVAWLSWKKAVADPLTRGHAVPL